MCLSCVPFAVTAEESSVAPIADAYNITLVKSGPDNSFSCTINDAPMEGGTYSGSDESITIKVTPAEGFAIKAAAFGPLNSSQSLSLGQDNAYVGTFTPVPGETHILFVQTEAAPVIPSVENTLAVESNVKYEVYGNDGNLVSDLSSATFAVGDSVKVKFIIDGEFNAEKATLSVNGQAVSPAVSEYTFAIAEGKNTLSFNYDTSVPKVPAAFNFDGVNVSFTMTDSKGKEISDISSVMVGDKVTVTFATDGTFIPDNASFSYNGEEITLSSASYTFTAKDTNTFVYSYEAKTATITVEAGDVAWWIYADDGSQLDITSATIITGDKLKIVFDNTFDPATTRLFINGKRQNLENVEHTFTVNSTKVSIVLKSAVNVDVDVETHGVDSSTIPFDVTVNGKEVEHDGYKYEEGDEIKITFKVSDFSADKAFLKLNNESVTLSGNSFSFVATDINTVVFGYGVSPIRFTIKGPGSVEIRDGEGNAVATVTNTNASGRITKTVYLNSGEDYTVVPKASLNYELSGSVTFDGITGSGSGNSYTLTADAAGTVSATFVKAQTAVPTFKVNINVNEGGSLDLESTSGIIKTIVGGITGSDITEVAEGDSVTFTVTAAEGFVLDKVLINNQKITVENNQFVISGIVSTQSVDVFFKSGDPVDPADVIGVDDIDWFAETIIINVPAGKVISGEVFTKIATELDGSSGKYVEIVAGQAIIYYPYGGVINDVGETVSIGTTAVTAGKEFSDIKSAAADQFEKGFFFKVFSVNRSEQMPEGTKISFNLGAGYANKHITLYTFDGNSFFDVSENLESTASGYSAKFDYGNQPTLICVNEPKSETEESKTSQTEDTTSEENSKADDSKDKDSQKGGNSTVIVIIIISLVAVAGAVALFVVKWRQEKF